MNLSRGIAVWGTGLSFSKGCATRQHRKLEMVGIPTVGHIIVSFCLTLTVYGHGQIDGLYQVVCATCLHSLSRFEEAPPLACQISGQLVISDFFLSLV